MHECTSSCCARWSIFPWSSSPLKHSMIRSSTSRTLLISSSRISAAYAIVFARDASVTTDSFLSFAAWPALSAGSAPAAAR